jgi:hypothetical protein
MAHNVQVTYTPTASPLVPTNTPVVSDTAPSPAVDATTELPNPTPPILAKQLQQPAEPPLQEGAPRSGWDTDKAKAMDATVPLTERASAAMSAAGGVLSSGLQKAASLVGLSGLRGKVEVADVVVHTGDRDIKAKHMAGPVSPQMRRLAALSDKERHLSGLEQFIQAQSQADQELWRLEEAQLVKLSADMELEEANKTYKYLKSKLGEAEKVLLAASRDVERAERILRELEARQATQADDKANVGVLADQAAATLKKSTEQLEANRSCQSAAAASVSAAAASPAGGADKGSLPEGPDVATTIQ